MSMMASARHVAVVGYGSIGPGGDALSSFLFRTGKTEQALDHLSRRMGVSKESLRGHHGIRTCEPEVIGWDPRNVTRYRRVPLADGVFPFQQGRTIGVEVTDSLPVTFAGQRPTGWDWKTVAGFKGPRFVPMGLASKMAVFSALESIADIQISWSQFLQSVPPEMIGTYISSAIGSGDKIQEMHVNPPFGERVGAKILAEALPDTPGAHVGMILGLEGVYSCPVGACATAGLSLYDAVHAIQEGRQIAAFAGGFDAALVLGGMEGFIAATALVDDAHLAKHGLTPAQASRAFDLLRGGFVMAEGGGLLFLVELETALRLGLRIRALIGGVGNRGDGFQKGLPSPGPGIRKAHDEAFAMAEKRFKLTIDDVGFYEAHGTSTDQNDPNEARHFQEYLADRGRDRARRVPVTSLKDEEGHTLGGAAGREQVETVQVLETGELPGHPNLTTLDPAIAVHDLLSFPKTTQRIQARAGQGGTLGFGHHNASWIILAGDDERLTEIAGEEEVKSFKARRAKNEDEPEARQVRAGLANGTKKLFDLLPKESR